MSESFEKPIWDERVLLPGDCVGRWRVRTYLGSGGFGAVYGVEELCDAFGRPVEAPRHAALKIYKGDPDNDTCHGKDRIQQETWILNALQNEPCLPALYDKGEWKGRPYFVREELEPVDAQELPSDNETLTKFLCDLLDSLAILHHAGWLHGDVKPWNIARRRADNRYVLIDFGSAHKIETGEHVYVPGQKTINTQDGRYVRIASRGYDAPEDSFSPARDIYAVGHVIRDCFEGDVPFAWGMVINRCISNQPKWRYGSVESLKADIENLHDLQNTVYWRLRKDRIAKQREIERSLDQAVRQKVTWEEVVCKDESRSNAQMTMLRVSLTKTPRVHYAIEAPIVLAANTVLVISGQGILEADIRGPASAVIVLRSYAAFHNTTQTVPPENDLTYVMVGPGSYLNFPNVSSEDYRRFFPGRRRVLRDLDATTSFRFGGPSSFSGVEGEAISAVRESDMPPGYKDILVQFFRGDIFTVLPPGARSRAAP